MAAPNDPTPDDATTYDRSRMQWSHICKVCDGRIHHYPPPDPITEGPLGVSTWAHLDAADWIDNPHTAEPKEEA